MRIRLRAPVLATDGARVGHVRYLLVDSSSRRLQHVVVGDRRRTSLDRRVPIRQLEPAKTESGAMRVDLTEAEFSRLPEFVDVETARDAAAASHFQPPRVTGFGDLSAPLVQREEALSSDPSSQRERPDGASVIMLGRHTEIVSTPGEKTLGHLFALECDDNGQLVGLIGRQRLFRAREFWIGAQQIIAMSNQQIQGTVADDADAIETPPPDAEIAGPTILSLSDVQPEMVVWGADGTRLGVIDTVERSGETARAIIVRHGLFGRLRKRLIVDVVGSVTTAGVYLTLERAEFKRLPDLHS